MRRWWLELGTRERWTVAGGAYFIVLALLFVALLDPVRADLGAMRARLERESAVLSGLVAAAREAEALRSRATVRPAGAAGQSLFSLITATAGSAGMARVIVRITPRGDGEVALMIENARFNDLSAWLAAIAADHGVEVLQAAFGRQGEPGFVSGNLTLAYGG